MGFIRDVEGNFVIVLGFVEGEEREDMFLVVCMEIFIFIEVLEKKVFVEFVKVFVWDLVIKFDIVKLEDFLVRVDIIVEFFIFCSMEIVVLLFREIDMEFFEWYVEDIREEFFVLWLFFVEWDLFVVFDEILLFVLLVNGDWLIKGVEIVVMILVNCKDVFLVLFDMDGEVIIIEEMREVFFWIVDWIKEFVMLGSLIWFELFVVVVGVVEEMLLFMVDKDDIFWVGLSVVFICGLGVLCDVVFFFCEEIYKEN